MGQVLAQIRRYGCAIFDSSQISKFMYETLKNLIVVSGWHLSFQNCNFYPNRQWCRPDRATLVSMKNHTFIIKHYKIYFYLSSHGNFKFHQTVSAPSTTGICIVSRSIDLSIQIPCLVYTLKVIVITKITKTFRHPQKPTTTTLCQEYLKLHKNVFTMHRVCIYIGLRYLD